MFLCRIQLNHPYTHKRHRSLPARASRRKSAPLVTSSETRRPTGFGENDSENPPSILIVVLVPESKVLRDNEPRSKRRAAALLADLLRERPDEQSASVVKKQMRRIARVLKYVPLRALEA